MRTLNYNSLMFIKVLSVFAFGLFNINLSVGNYVSRDYRGSVLDREDKCGISKTYSTYRIMRGKDADLGEFPWMVVLFYKSKYIPNKFVSLCGGSIIHESYILTAAHCCHKNLSFVRIGEFDVSTAIDCQDGRCAPPHQDLEIETYINHPKYIFTKKNQNLYNDICLIKLTKPLKFNEYVFPICLPINGDKEIIGHGSKRFLATGWGRMDLKNYADTLQKVSLPYVPYEECQQAWSWPDIDDATQICAGMDKGRDICSGDSGGPLMTHSKDNGPRRLIQVGLVSYGTLCNLSDTEYQPAVYTRVSHYLPWILQNMH